MGKHAEAVGLLLRFALACHSLQLRSSQCKAYLGALVVWLFAGDAAQAWAVYQVLLGFCFSFQPPFLLLVSSTVRWLISRICNDNDLKLLTPSVLGSLLRALQSMQELLRSIAG